MPPDHLSNLSSVQPTSSAARVAASLRRLIALGAVLPGERLPTQRELADTLSVGRESIGAAIRTLAAESLVETRRGRRGGTFVSDRPQRDTASELTASHREITATFELRRIVESAAAALAARRATSAELETILSIARQDAWSIRSWRAVDSRFHDAVAAASHNPLLIETIRRTREAFFGWYDIVFARVDWTTLPNEDREFSYQHLPIAQAIAGRDADRAEELMRAALEWSERDLAQQLDHYARETASRHTGNGGGASTRTERGGAR